MRKFGVEIELGLKDGATRATVSSALRAVGLGGTAQGYSGHDEHYWVVKTDASVYNGVEVVSPPLDFDNPEQRAQVTTAVRAIQPHCQPVPSAGIHVHIESRDLTPRQISGVARTFTHFEDVIYRLASSGWQTIRPGAQQYAYPMDERRTDAISKAKSERALKQAWYGAHSDGSWSHGDGSRYHALNLHSHFYRGTIEFRVFNSSLNPKRVNTYVAICMALVQDARNGHLRSVKKATRLGAMANGSADGAKAFFRFQQIVRYFGDMGLADFKNLKVLWKDSRAQQAMRRGY